MEGVFSLRDHCEHFPDEPRLHHLRLPKHSTIEPSGISRSEPRPSFHGGHQLCDQHKPSTLQWRRSVQQSAQLPVFVIDTGTLLSQPDDRSTIPTIHQCCHRPLRRRCHGPRFRFSKSEFGKLLHRLCSVSDPTFPSTLFCRSPDLCCARRSPDHWRVSNRPNSGGNDPDDSGGTRRITCQHHADRHERWRLLWSKLCLPIPEPESGLGYFPDSPNAPHPDKSLLRLWAAARKKTGGSSDYHRRILSLRSCLVARLHSQLRPWSRHRG